ncbi:PA2779 family protein [Noviherbaspirillum sp. 17J57-3]|uniref:PA2779 family protein n=2 Tax=Noviherbaspirillum galbum TaxID=2709383 RepID=A0A6B3SP98_9BURK|nr:PA2779 family protein [Noviherbaspirillum galbum]
MVTRIKRACVYAALASMTFAGFAQTTQAAMIGTDQVASAAVAEQQRARIAAALDRPEVARQLEGFGVSKEDAQARVAALSDAEAAQLAQRIDSMPAGGDVVGALVFIFVLLLVTDLLGLTRVYPFTRHR